MERAARIHDKLSHGDVLEKIEHTVITRAIEKKVVHPALHHAEDHAVQKMGKALIDAETAEEITAIGRTAEVLGKVAEAASVVGDVLLIKDVIDIASAVVPLGTISGPGSPVVFINGEKAAMATDQVYCMNPLCIVTQQSLGMISTGSNLVFIHRVPAARSGSKVSSCGANVVGGASNVFFGGQEE